MSEKPSLRLSVFFRADDLREVFQTLKRTWQMTFRYIIILRLDELA